ncbi:zinc finger protein 410-like isoform X1 [Huso huso]|uniref:Zinc finger protein 410-like isoform X1 n=1 Tax=Huso huso TaxID=61971 RepID=A0ABR0Z254_HUSHU
MLSDELDSKPELLVEFVQNASIPLGQGLEECDPKGTCLSLLPCSENSVCSQLQLAGTGLSHQASPALSDYENERESLMVQLQPHRSVNISPTPSSPSILHDLQQTDSTSFILLNLAKGLAASAEPLVFVQDEVYDPENEFSTSENADGSTPWYLRVQELAHDSLIAATRAQLAKDAKASNSGDHLHCYQSEGPKKEVNPSGERPQNEKSLKCTFEGCRRTFTWPAHLKYHLKTHKNDRTFTCRAEGCGKSFYVLQRLQVHMRTHNGEKPFLCEAEGCGRSFAEYSSLRKHMLVHSGKATYFSISMLINVSVFQVSSMRSVLCCVSGEKPHQCTVCGKTFSQSGSRNVHMRKRHNAAAPASDTRGEAGDALTHSSLLEDQGIASENVVSMATQCSLEVERINLHHSMLRAPEDSDEDIPMGRKLWLYCNKNIFFNVKHLRRH